MMMSVESYGRKLSGADLRSDEDKLDELIDAIAETLQPRTNARFQSGVVFFDIDQTKRARLHLLIRQWIRRGGSVMTGRRSE